MKHKPHFMPSLPSPPGFIEGTHRAEDFAGSREDEPRSSLERKWGAIRVLAPRSMGENKFGLGAARLYAKQLTDGDGQESGGGGKNETGK